jgi:acetyltransferase-like isoleucine patch superfamily enzyme
MKFIKPLYKTIRNIFLFYKKTLFIQYKNPDLIINLPIVWIYDNYKNINISPGVTIGAFSEIVVLEKNPYSSITGSLVIEERVIIGSCANIRAAGGEIYIGRNTMLAQGVSLIAANHKISHEKAYRDLSWDESKTGIFIDENVWLGSGVTVLPGCTIGKNSIIGAGSVVTKSIPSNEIWAGVPAKKIKIISEFSHSEIKV